VTDTLQSQVPTDTILIVAPSTGTEKSVCAALLSAGYRIEVIQESDVRSVTSQREDACLALVITAHAGLSHSQTNELCSVLRLREPTLPLIVLGPDVLSVKFRFFTLGVDDYVVDSSDRTELLAHIRALIRKRRFLSPNSAGR
jgi:DNA-binding response OmpR family regulator